MVGLAHPKGWCEPVGTPGQLRGGTAQGMLSI